MCRDAINHEVYNPKKQTNAVLAAAAEGNSDDITMTRVAMSWWRDRLKYPLLEK